MIFCCSVQFLYWMTYVNMTRISLCSSWPMFHQQLILLREIFQKKWLSRKFSESCFKLLLFRLHILKVSTVEKKPLWLVLPNLGTISLLQTRTKLQNSIKEALNCCKLQVIFKSQNKLCNNFHFKDPVYPNS